MSLKLLVILFIILSYAGVHLIFRKRTLGILVGMEYLLVGFLFSLYDTNARLLEPLLYAFLGWIGLLTGTQLKISYLVRLEKYFYSNVIVFAAVKILLISCIISFFIDPYYAFIIGISLSPVSFRSVAQYIKKDRYVLFFTSTIPFVTLVCFFLFYLLQLTVETINILFLFIAVYCIISRFVLTLVNEKDSINLILVGLIILISQTGALLDVSPLLINFIVGVYLANFCPLSDEIFTSLYKDEKPLYIMFLLLVGMLAGINTDTAVLLYGLLFTAIALGATFVIVRVARFRLLSTPWHLFAAPGGFSIAVAADYWLFRGGVREEHWMSSFLLCAVMLQFISGIKSKFYENRTSKNSL